MAALTDGIAGLATADEWQRHLRLQTRFHRYSFGNVVLIAAQRPDATRVAGFRTWEKVGRRVRKGERALWILAPMVARRAAHPDDARSDGDADRHAHRVIRGFRTVPVFDVSQTEGDDLPEACRLLSGEDPSRTFDGLCAVAAALDYRVEDARLPAGTNGDCTFAERRIRIEVGNAPAQRVKTLAHDRLTAPPGARLVYLNGALSRVVHRYTSSSKDGEVTAMPDSGEIDHSVHPSTNPVLPTKNCGQSAMACPR
jgi:hypothetical protein